MFECTKHVQVKCVARVNDIAALRRRLPPKDCTPPARCFAPGSESMLTMYAQPVENCKNAKHAPMTPVIASCSVSVVCLPATCQGGWRMPAWRTKVSISDKVINTVRQHTETQLFA